MVSAPDRAGTYVYANAAFAAALDARPADILGSSAASLLGPERGAASQAQDLAVFETGQPSPPRREVQVDANGSHRIVSTVRTPLRDATGSVIAVVTTAFLLPAEDGR